MPKTMLRVAAALALCCLPSMGMAFNVTIDFTGANSAGGNFADRVWTPTADSTIAKEDIQEWLEEGDVTIKTNGPGYIRFTPIAPLFIPQDASRTLVLLAEGDITDFGVTALNGAVNVVLTASGEVNIDGTTDTNGGDFTSTGTDFSLQNTFETKGGDVFLNHTGSISSNTFYTQGGDLTFNGTDFSCSFGCINTTVTGTVGGKVTLNHTGSVLIKDGGVQTGGGDLISSGTDFTCSGGGCRTEGGNVTLNHTGSVSLTGGVQTGGGDFTSNGSDFLMSGGGITSGGGAVSLNHSGSVVVTLVRTGRKSPTAGEILLAGGDFTSSGTDFHGQYTGIETTGGEMSGNVTLNHTGSVKLEDGGVNTGGGDFISSGTDFSCAHNGCRTGGGNMTLNHTGNVDITDNGLQTLGGTITVYDSANFKLEAGSSITSGSTDPDDIVSGGEIILHATDSMTIDGDVSTKAGSEGPLFIDEGVSVNGTVTAGEGALLLLLRPRAFPQAPSAPRKPVVTRGNGEATVRWIKPRANGSPIAGYTVTSSGGQTCSTTDADTTSCVVTGLTNGTSYTFTVTATNAEGTSYPSPASRPIFPSTDPVPPATPFAPVATAGDGQASVTWTKPADNGVTISGYTVTSSGGQRCSTTGADTLTCVVTGLTNGTAYTFTVTANNIVGNSDPSPDSNSVTPGTEPATPSAPVATAGDSQASVTWTKPADNGPPIRSYTVTSSAGQVCTTNDADTLTCDVTGLTNGTAYTFTVKATNALGTSAASAPSNSVTPAAPAPAAPATPVPTLPLFGLGILVSLLGLFGLRKLRQ